METTSYQPNKLFFIAALSCFVILSVCGSPAPVSLKLDDSSLDNYNYNSSDFVDCNLEEHDLRDVIFRDDRTIFLISQNREIISDRYFEREEKLFVCPSLDNSGNETFLDCENVVDYNSTEFEILPNKSALLFGFLIPPTEYLMKDEILTACSDYEYYQDESEDDKSDSDMEKASILVGQIGSGISIFALIIYLIAFCFVPALNNLPGYNLASLSVAFLLAFSFLLIGQIPEVLGLSCVISAVLQQNFFLSAFFCMNVLAFDVWKTLKLATENFRVISDNTRRRQFLYYSLYAWGCPLVITFLSVIIDNSDKVPKEIKPNYGADDICYFGNVQALYIFVVAPLMTLLIINSFFFVTSFWMISRNQMKKANDQDHQTVKFNYILYLRLGLMMGMTWLTLVIALISANEYVWLIFDLVNSLQGLFLLLLFTCRRKVLKQIREKIPFLRGSSEGESNSSSGLSSNVSNLSNTTNYQNERSIKMSKLSK